MSQVDFLDNVKVNLETMTRCGGSCDGCILLNDERKHGNLWGASRLNRLTSIVSEFIEGHLNRFDPLEVSINCGQGDHLLAESVDLDALVRWIGEAGQGRAIGFLTASAVGRPDRVQRAVDAIRNASLRLNQPIMLDLVFDPVKTTVGNFRGAYAGNIEYIRDAFGEVDFTVNIGPDTLQVISPDTMHAFLGASGIGRFTLNFVPTRHTAPMFQDHWRSIMAWSGEFLRRWGPHCGYEINFGQAISVIMQGAKGLEAEGPTELARLVNLSAGRSLFIDHTDWIWHSQEGFGDIAFSGRVGWAPSTRLPSTGQAFHSIQSSARRFTARLLGDFESDNRCTGCRFNLVCPRIGAGALRSAFGPTGVDDNCPTGLYPLLETFEQLGLDNNLESLTCRKDFTHLPVGFGSTVRPHAAPVTRSPPALSMHHITKETSA